VLICPSAGDSPNPATDWPNIGGVSMGITNYKGVSGSNWAWSSNGAYNYNDPVFGNNGLDKGNGCFYRSDGNRKLTLMTITDGTSNTLMIGESYHSPSISSTQSDQHCGGWAYPNYVNATCAIPLNFDDIYNTSYGDWVNRYSFHSKHDGGGNFCMADATVRFVSNNISYATYTAASTVKGNEVSSLDP
jgi:hypothetical protein